MGFGLTRFTDKITRVSLSPPIEGFDDFICAWVVTGEETLVIDPGPSTTSGELLAALRQMNVPQPDFILLTHIHIDHAGGIGEIAAAFPAAPVVCHEVALPHLIDPGRLWLGTVKTLGQTGRAYGPITPVPTGQLTDARNFSTATVRPVFTPGHAPHHISFITPDGIVFAGEAGGVCIDFVPGRLYLRPATPPRFSLETSVAAIDRLLAEKPRTVCYGHTAFKTDAAGLLKKHKEQLFLWEGIIAEEIGHAHDRASGSALESNMDEARGEELVARCASKLMKTDPLLSPLAGVPPPVHRRERFFIANSVRGFIGALAATRR